MVPSRRSFLKSAVFLKPHPFIASFDSFQSKNHTTSKDWRFHHHDVHNSNSTPAKGPISEPEISWKRQLTHKRRWGYWYPTPVIVDGVLYIGGDGLFALDAQTGSTNWHVSETESIFGPAVINKSVYVGCRKSQSGAVRAYNTRNGKIIWESNVTSKPSRFRPIMVSKDKVYAPINSGDPPSTQQTLIVIDRESGAKKKGISTQADYSIPPGIFDETIYTNGPKQAELQSLSSHCNLLCQILGNWIRRHWKTDVVHPWHAPAISQDYVYIGGQGEIPPSRGGYDGISLMCLKIKNGEMVYKKELGFNIPTPAVHNGSIYATSMQVNGKNKGTKYGTDTFIYRFNKESGELVWKERLAERRVWGSPTLADDILYVPTLPSQTSNTKSRLHAFRAKSGEYLWKVDLPNDACTTAVAEGHLYVCGWDGQIVALSEEASSKYK